jgi:hypothetical protein
MLIATAAVDAAGQASAATSELPMGEHTIVASYSGDGCFAPSSAAITQVVSVPRPARG